MSDQALTTPDDIFAALSGTDTDYIQYGGKRHTISIRELTGDEAQLVIAMTEYVRQKREKTPTADQTSQLITEDIHPDEIAPDSSIDADDDDLPALYIEPRHAALIDSVFASCEGIGDSTVYSAYGMTLIIADDQGNRVFSDEQTSQVAAKFPSRDMERLFKRYITPHLFVQPGDAEIKNSDQVQKSGT
jgi:hypothetical protein